MALDNADLPTQRELRTRRPPTVLGLHDEYGNRTSHGVRISMGDRERLQIDQAVHGRHNVETLRPAVLLLRVRLSPVLDLEGGRSAGSGAVDR